MIDAVKWQQKGENPEMEDRFEENNEALELIARFEHMVKTNETVFF